MPNQAKTPMHTVRVDPELWAAATARAVENGETVSAAIRRFLKQYAAGTVLLAALALFLTGCGQESPGATPDAGQAAPVAEVQEPTPEPVAAESEVPEPAPEPVPLGAAQPVDAGTMRVVRVESDAGTSKVIIEVSTRELVHFDGTYTAIDAAGNNLTGTPALDAPSANGIGGWFVTFDAPELLTVTYVPTSASELAPVSWTVG